MRRILAIGGVLACALAGCGVPGMAPSAIEATSATEATAAEATAAERPGLGTRFGEAHRSAVVSTRFERAAAMPFAEVALHYNDVSGTAALAEFRGAVPGPIRASTPRGGIDVAIVGDGGEVLPGFVAGGRVYVVGRDGDRYRIAVSNDTGGRFEVVASVDGLDVVDGRAAGFAKRGYVVAPYSTVVIEGFRTSADTVAAFRFGSVADSYAARTAGDRNVGVIGLAFFSERGSRWTTDELERRDRADPFPDRYAAPPG